MSHIKTISYNFAAGWFTMDLQTTNGDNYFGKTNSLPESADSPFSRINIMSAIRDLLKIHREYSTTTDAKVEFSPAHNGKITVSFEAVSKFMGIRTRVDKFQLVCYRREHINSSLPLDVPRYPGIDIEYAFLTCYMAAGRPHIPILYGAMAYGINVGIASPAQVWCKFHLKDNPLMRAVITTTRNKIGSTTMMIATAEEPTKCKYDLLAVDGNLYAHQLANNQFSYSPDGPTEVDFAVRKFRFDASATVSTSDAEQFAPVISIVDRYCAIQHSERPELATVEEAKKEWEKMDVKVVLAYVAWCNEHEYGAVENV